MNRGPDSWVLITDCWFELHTIVEGVSETDVHMRHFNMISIRYDFHPFCLLRKVMAEILVSCGIDGT